MYIYKHLNIYQNMFFLVAQKSSSLPYNLHHDHHHLHLYLHLHLHRTFYTYDSPAQF